MIKRVICSCKFLMPIFFLLLYFPYFLPAQIIEQESFEDLSFPPAGWTILNGNFVNGTPPNTGSWLCKSSQLVNILGLGRAVISSKQFDLRSRGSSPAGMSFHHINTALLTLGLQKVNVYINTVPSLTGAHLLGTVTPQANHTQGVFSFPQSYTGNSNFVLFEVTSPLAALMPGVGMDDVKIITYPSADVSLRLILEGAYNGTAMDSSLANEGYIAGMQPYGMPSFRYYGMENVDSAFYISHPDIVDWILIELRGDSSAGSAISRRAAFLKTDGTLLDTSGAPYVRFNNIPSAAYYIAVYHRNHLIIMTPQAVVPPGLGAYAYDFTTGADKYYGGVTKNLGNGRFGMYGGNTNADFMIDSLDISAVDDAQSWMGYFNTDTDLDGIVDADDYICIELNKGKVAVVPYILN